MAANGPTCSGIAEGTRLAFVSTSRDHKVTTLRIANPTTGEVRDVLEEKVPTFFESGNGRVNWRFLPESKEFLWFSERDNWGHLYLYDSETGKLKNQITKGDWNVTQLLRVDEKNRLLYFLGVGREKGDPYFVHFYRIAFDGSGLTLLTPEDANHEVTLAPSGKYFTDSYSTPTTPARGGAARRQRQTARHAGEGRYLQARSPPAGNHPSPSRSRRATARPTCTA